MVYVVEALRYGDREKHSYIVGVFNGLRSAVEESITHEHRRSGKYRCVINEFEVDQYNFEHWEHCVNQCLTREEFLELVCKRMEEYNSLDEMARIAQEAGEYDA